MVEYLNFIQKWRQGNAPDYLFEQIQYVREMQLYSLRNAGDFRLQRATSVLMKRSLFCNGLQLFITLPNEIKLETNNYIFRKQAVLFIENIII